MCLRLLAYQRKLVIDDTHLCFPCLCQLKKKKSLEVSFTAASKGVMRNYVPPFASSDDMLKFRPEAIFEEWMEKAPLFYSILMPSAL